jgi:hypothetical protein
MRSPAQPRLGTERGDEGDLGVVLTGVGEGRERPETGDGRSSGGRRHWWFQSLAFGSLEARVSGARYREGREDHGIALTSGRDRRRWPDLEKKATTAEYVGLRVFKGWRHSGASPAAGGSSSDSARHHAALRGCGSVRRCSTAANWAASLAVMGGAV